MLALGRRAGTGLVEMISSVCRANTQQDGLKGWRRLRLDSDVWDQVPAVSAFLLHQHKWAGVLAGRSRDETAWFKDKNVSYSTIDPSISVPRV